MQAFDLAQDLPIRASLFRLAADEHVLLLSLHHIATDGWSQGVMRRDLGALYQAAVQGVAPTLPALPIQYADYAIWQRSWLHGDALQRQLHFWRDRLEGMPRFLALAADHPRPPVHTFRGATYERTFSPELTAALRRFGQQHGCTLFMTALSAFAVVMGRHSGQQQFVIGSPIANRHHQAVEALVGFFVNTLALPIDLARAPRFADLLAQVRRTTLDAYAHQDLPFERLVETLDLERDLSHNPLVQVVFAVQNAPRSTLRLGDSIAQSFDFDVDTVRSDLEVHLWEDEQTIHCFVPYYRDLFEPARIARLIDHFEQVLLAITAQADQALHALAPLSAADAAWLQAVNPQADTRDAALTVIDRFEQIVDRLPQAEALRFTMPSSGPSSGLTSVTSLSYQQLDALSNRIAHALIARGAGPDTLVALCVPRSIEMVAALLGILKAGAAYVPLDPDYPEQRLDMMLSDAEPHLMLVHSEALQRLPVLADRAAQSQATILAVDQGLGWLSDNSQRPVRRASPDHLAYVLYTSGSTGTPKGVMLPHRALSNLIGWQAQQAGLDQPRTTLQFTSLSFDVSFQEIFSTWSQGGTLVLVDDALRRDPSALLDYIAEQGIERLYLPFVALQHLAEEAVSRPRALVLRELITAGEQLQMTPALRQWLADSGMGLHNHYGPTESHVVTAHSLPALVAADSNVDGPSTCADWPALPPIGAPIANTRIYLLDAALQPVPPGVAGELCIAGDCLARGYLNRPELTAERFVTLTVLGRDERVYRTGDQARWLPNGELEYLGRLDHQVKIRGFRVELGEIEAQLAAHPDVASTTVVVRENSSGSKTLAAYLVLRQPVAAAELRSWLKQRLPDYMIPASLTVLDAMPLTPSGKVDRRALPEPSDEAGQGRALNGPSEELLASIWAEILGVQELTAASHFFDLGGHSLLATRVVSRIRERFDIACPLRVLFERPVLSDLAAWLDHQQRGTDEQLITPLPEGSALRPSPAQEGLWFLAQLDGGSASYNMPAAMRLRGPLDEAALRQSLVALTERQASLRQSFVHIDGALTLRERAAWDPVVLIDLSDQPADHQHLSVRDLVQQHALAPFDLSQGPLLRVTLLRLAADHHILLLNLHHSINDGWSYGVLVREWAELYSAAREQRPAHLPVLPVAYRDVAAWQHQWLASAGAQDQLRWWLDHLTGAPALLDLPTDFPRPAQQSYRGDRRVRMLSPQLSQAVKTLSRQQGVTLFMTLLSALQVLLHRHSGQDDLCIGTPVANRGQRQTENLVGLFINTLALRAKIDPQASFADLLAQTRQTALAAFARQEMPFERVVEALSPERSLAHAPVFQALFVMQNNASADFAFADVQIESVDQDTPIAKYDLTLSAEEGPDGVLCHWEFASDLFAAERIERMAAQFEQILATVTEAPQTAIAAIDMLTHDDLAQLQAFGHGGALPAAPADQTVVDRFEAQAQRTPDAPAISFGDASLSYAQLAAHANQVAHRLQALGAGPDTLVGLCMPRSLELVVGMLGILKSGAAYVPLEPDYPAQRLAMMLQDTAAPVVLTHSSVRDRLPDMPGVAVLSLDDPATAQGLPTTPPANTIAPQHLAYVIYTSGSTGVPKGVAIEHRSLAASTQAREQVFGATGQTLHRLMLVPSFAFDAFGAGLWHALSIGMAVDLPASITDLPAIRARIAERSIDALFGPPVWYRALISLEGLEPQAAPNGQPLALQTLRQVTMGGEAPSPALLLEHAQRMPATRLFSEYGPTEASVWCTATEYTDPQQNVHVIGKPIPGTDLILLDAQNRRVPVGVPGELHIAGSFLARGYLNRAEQTQAQFATVMVDGQPQRLYRTGDLARWLPDGQLEFLGRRDHQIKLRGMRIELGEIEAALIEQAAIAQCAVVCAGGQGPDQRLIGHLVLTPGHTELPFGPLRDALKARLPEHMVPRGFVIHTQLPVTPNGKLDRVALAAIDPGASTQDADIAPRSLLELQLLRIWQDVLKTDAIGLHDSFFDAGGNSLRVASLASVIERRLGIKVPVGMLFRENSIARQAAYLQAHRGNQAPSVLVPLQPHGHLTPLFCVHPGGGTVIWYRHLAYRFNPQRPLYGLDSQGIADDATPMDRIETMAAAYVQAIRSVQPQGPYAIAGWCFGGMVAVEMARQLRALGQAVDLLIIFDALDPHPPFNEALLQDVGFFVELFKTDVPGLEALHQQLADLPEPQQLQQLIEAARLAGEVSDDFGLEQARRQLAIFRGHMLAQRDYQLQPVPGKVVFLQAAQGMAAQHEDPIFGWGARVDEAEVHWVPGDHTGMMVEPQVGHLAQTLEMLMARTFDAGGA